MAQSIDEILTPEKGNILRKAREARGLSVSDVSARLRLNPHFIEAMESGDIRPLPPGPYRKAFLTEYAKFLNIKLDAIQHITPIEEKDNILSSTVSAMPGVAKKITKSAVKTTESVVKKVEEGVKDAVEEITARDLWEEADQVREERLGRTKKQDEEPKMAVRKKDAPLTSRISVRRQEREIIDEVSPTPEESKPIPKETSYTSRLIQENIPNKSYSPSYEREEEKEVSGGMSRATKTIVGLLIIISAIVGYSIFTKKQNQSLAPIGPEEKTAAKLPEQKTKPISPAKRDSAAVIALPNDSLIFTISAKDSVWVSVSPDIGMGFRGKLAKGEVKRFSAKEKYFLFLGNQKSVSMTLDGKPLTNLPTVPGSNIVVRNAIIMRDKVSIAPSEQSKSELKKEVQPHKKENVKKNATPLAKKKPQPTPKKKAAKNPPIKMRIPSVKPVLPG